MLFKKIKKGKALLFINIYANPWWFLQDKLPKVKSEAEPYLVWLLHFGTPGHMLAFSPPPIL